MDFFFILPFDHWSLFFLFFWLRVRSGGRENRKSRYHYFPQKQAPKRKKKCSFPHPNALKKKKGLFFAIDSPICNYYFFKKITSNLEWDEKFSFSKKNKREKGKIKLENCWGNHCLFLSCGGSSHPFLVWLWWRQLWMVQAVSVPVVSFTLEGGGRRNIDRICHFFLHSPLSLLQNIYNLTTDDRLCTASS